MWIVRLALRRPYTFVVAALLILVLGVVTIERTPVDIFPEVNIPVITVIWSFTGLSPDDMEKRVLTVTERAMTTAVNDIEHMESQSMYGVGVIKVFFHQGADTAVAQAQVTALVQTLLRFLPQGMTPPLSSAIARPACRSCSSPLRARRCRRSSSTTTPRISSAPSSPPCRAPR